MVLLHTCPDACCRLVERFLMDGYEPRQDSTYALTLYRHDAMIDGKEVRLRCVPRSPCCHPAVPCSRLS